MSNYIKDLAWFTIHSWYYLQGDRKRYITGFWAAWKDFKVSTDKDRKAGFVK